MLWGHPSTSHTYTLTGHLYQCCSKVLPAMEYRRLEFLPHQCTWAALESLQYFSFFVTVHSLSPIGNICGFQHSVCFCTLIKVLSEVSCKPVSSAFASCFLFWMSWFAFITMLCLFFSPCPIRGSHSDWIHFASNIFRGTVKNDSLTSKYISSTVVFSSPRFTRYPLAECLGL